MMFRSITRLGLLAATGTLFFGCESDLDVTAPYKEITVVYSLLNKNDNIHWVKINKAFLGDGDAFLYATIPDSTEYTEEQMPESARRIEKIDVDGNVAATFTLHDTILNDRLPGLFNGPLHKMYYFRGDGPNGTLDAGFNPPGYNEGYRYRLVATAKGNRVESITPVVNDLQFRTTISDPDIAISLYQGQAYTNYLVRFNTTKNARRYEVHYRFHYDEVKNGVTTTMSFDNFIGTVVSSNQNGQEENVAMNGALFFQTVANRVRYTSAADEDAVSQRIFRGIEFYAYVAAPELHTYLQLANPISGIVEERPDYSNITGGYGLMSSRMFEIVPNEAEGGNADFRKRLENSSNTELKEGQYTGTLKFCVPSPLSADC
jgi:hypothetical protein